MRQHLDGRVVPRGGIAREGGPSPAPSSPDQHVLSLQRTAGNRAVGAMMQRRVTASVPVHPAGGLVVVQRDLAGSASVLAEVSAGKVGKRKMSKWAKLIQALSTYEAAEGRIRRKQQSPGQRVRQTDLEDLIDRLGQVRTLMAKWRKQNEKEALQERRKFEQQFGTIRNNRDLQRDDPVEEEGKKARQLGVLNILERRVAFEERALRDQSWLKLSSFSDTNVSDVQDNAVGGALNRLDRGQWRSGSNVTRGFFAKDKHVDPSIDISPGTQIGITPYDPNYSGRSVAMAQIDRLITEKIQEVARRSDPRMLIDMQFATHTRDTAPNSGEKENVMGVVGELAEGQELRGGFIAPGETRLGGEGEGLSLDDPALQRGMNKLQLLDAICGQIDRHMANIFVDTDEGGGVTRVTGIDNDLAFGQSMDSVQRRGGRLAAGSWRGLPPIADKAMAQAILAITPELIRHALEGLLAPQEVEATVSRFTQVQEFLRDLDPGKLIEHDEWMQKREELAKEQTSENSYLGVARDEHLTMWKQANGQQLSESVKRHTVTSVTQSFTVEEEVQSLPTFMGDIMAPWASDLTLVAVAQMKVQLTQVEDKSKELVDAFLRKLEHKDLKKNFMLSVRGPNSDARQRIERELPEIAQQLFG